MAKAANPNCPASSGALPVERGDFITTQAAANGVQVNSLMVDLNCFDGYWNKPWIITNQSTHIPGDLQIALREVYWLADNMIVVECTGMDTAGNHAKWICRYDAKIGNWTNWDRIATRSDLPYLMTQDYYGTLGKGKTSVNIPISTPAGYSYVSPINVSTVGWINSVYFSNEGTNSSYVQVWGVDDNSIGGTVCVRVLYQKVV